MSKEEYINMYVQWLLNTKLADMAQKIAHNAYNKLLFTCSRCNVSWFVLELVDFEGKCKNCGISLVDNKTFKFFLEHFSEFDE